MAELKIIPPEQGEDPAKVPDNAVIQPDGSATIADSDAATAESEKGAEESLILGKFKTQDDLVSAYQALERRLGQTSADKAPAQDNAQDSAKATVENAGLDFDALVSEYQQNGSVGEDSLKALEAKGITRQAVENYVQGQVARAALLTQTLATQVGGEESLKGLLQWAGENLSADEIGAYNAVIESGNVHQATLALTGLQAKQAAAGTEPKLVAGASSAQGGVQPYGSWAQVQKDMASKEYNTDHAFRRKVEARLAVSDL